MKKLFAAIIAMAFAATAQAQVPFTLNKEGAVAEYAMKGPDGTVASYTKTTVTKINAVDEANFTVDSTVEVIDGSRKALTAPMAVTTEVKDGAVDATPNSVAGMEITGTVPKLAANPVVGESSEYEFTIKMMGMDAVTKGKNTVAGREEITTPAGKFDCYRIDGDVSVVAMGQTQNAKTVTWIARGVGAVKVETRDGAGNVLMTQELVELK